jgi:hypothetical protein
LGYYLKIAVSEGFQMKKKQTDVSGKTVPSDDRLGTRDNGQKRKRREEAVLESSGKFSFMIANTD